MAGAMDRTFDYFGARDTFDTGNGEAVIYRLSALEGIADIQRLPASIRVMLEHWVVRSLADLSLKSHSARFDEVGVKTADSLLLRRWRDHHAGVVGVELLV